MFVLVAGVGAVLLALSFVFEDALDALLPESDWLTGPAVGAFLGAFGIVGWMTESGAGASRPVAVAVGTAAGLAMGAFTVRLAAVLMRSPTDPAPRTADLVGSTGRVVTAVKAGGTGEVLVSRGGQPTKLTATAAAALAVGTDVVVIGVESPTKVVVEAATEFWA
jgi:membrane protein implicated in regulation of membrane protease activity